MQYDARSPAEYLDMLENDWRKDKLIELRKLIKQLAPELEETIRYKMLSYDGAQGGAFALNAQKGSVNDTRIAEFIAKAMQMWRNGADFGC